MVLNLGRVCIRVWKLGVVGPKSSTDGGSLRHVADDWGYHPRKFHLIIHKLFYLWKVTTSYFIATPHDSPNDPHPKIWRSQPPNSQDWRLWLKRRTKRARYYDVNISRLLHRSVKYRLMISGLLSIDWYQLRQYPPLSVSIGAFSAHNSDDVIDGTVRKHCPTASPIYTLKLIGTVETLLPDIKTWSWSNVLLPDSHNS